MTKGAAPRRYVRNADRDRCEQAAAKGWTAEFTATELGVPVEVVDQVWAGMDQIHAETPTRPAAATAYGRQSHCGRVPSAGRAAVGRPSNAARRGEVGPKLTSPQITGMVDRLTFDGWSAAEIARHLGITSRTVVRHRTRGVS